MKIRAHRNAVVTACFSLITCFFLQTFVRTATAVQQRTMSIVPNENIEQIVRFGRMPGGPIRPKDMEALEGSWHESSIVALQHGQTATLISGPIVLQPTNKNRLAAGEIGWNSEAEIFEMQSAFWNVAKFNGHLLVGIQLPDGEKFDVFRVVRKHDPDRLLFFRFNFKSIAKWLNNNTVPGTLESVLGSEVITISDNEMLANAIQTSPSSEFFELEPSHYFCESPTWRPKPASKLQHLTSLQSLEGLAPSERNELADLIVKAFVESIINENGGTKAGVLLAEPHVNAVSALNLLASDVEEILKLYCMGVEYEHLREELRNLRQSRSAFMRSLIDGQASKSSGVLLYVAPYLKQKFIAMEYARQGQKAGG